MQDNLTTYKIWAPHNALWTQWAKPALFVNKPYGGREASLEIPEVNWISFAEHNKMIIVDLPGKSGVEEGLGLAKIGYRPVPLYNGVNAPSSESMIVDVQKIAVALYKGAEILNSLSLRNDAPPVFLLDSERMNGKEKEPGKYDNRWCIFPQDMPSADFILGRGIKEIIVRSSRIQNDLSHILCRYQERGIKIHICSFTEPMHEVKVQKPSQFRSLLYRFQVTMGLSRNASGGFGCKIPEAMESGSGRTYYGIG